MASWQVQEAKARLSEVIDQAISDGPQTITRHGKARAMIISVDQYESMTSNAPNFIDFLLSGPKFGDIEIERSHDAGREIDLE